MAVIWKAYTDANNEVLYFKDGTPDQSAADSDASLTRADGLDKTTSNDGLLDETPPNGSTNTAINAAKDRSTHTGTQTASTISDFASQVQANQTVTNLQIIGNTLRFTNESGADQDIDLSLYLDDTNLSRITSGTIDGVTNIATFTRDDLSTFTVDFSSLNDQAAIATAISDHVALADPHTQYAETTEIYTQAQLNAGQLDGRYYTETEIDGQQSTQDSSIALNTAKVSADGSIDTHSDVDTTTAAPASGDSLTFDGTNWVPKTTSNGFTIFPIWAEENGGLSGTNNTQWSFGNGATGAIGVTLGLDCELFALTLNAQAFGTNVVMNVLNSGSQVTQQTFTANNQFINLTAIPFNAGDYVGFATQSVSGTTTDARVTAWFRVSATAAFPTPDRSTVTNSAIAFSSGTFIDIPGMSTTVSLTDTGNVTASMNYSAQRSGGTNSESQWRCVINGDNGFSFSDTLSTFNDNGSCAHTVTGLAPGTYTVSGQCTVSEPITITAVSLTAVATED